MKFSEYLRRKEEEDREEWVKQQEENRNLIQNTQWTDNTPKNVNINKLLKDYKTRFGTNSDQYKNLQKSYTETKNEKLYGSKNPNIFQRIKGQANEFLNSETHPIEFWQRAFGNEEAQQRYEQRRASTWDKINQQKNKMSETNNIQDKLKLGLGIAKNYAGLENKEGIQKPVNTNLQINPIFDNQGMIANYRDKNVNLPTNLNTSQNIVKPEEKTAQEKIEKERKTVQKQDTLADEIIKKSDIQKSDVQLEGTELKSLVTALEHNKQLDEGKYAEFGLQRFGEDVQGAGYKATVSPINAVLGLAQGLSRLNKDEDATQGLIDLSNKLSNGRFNAGEIRQDVKKVGEATGRNKIINEGLYIGSNVVDNLATQLTYGMLAGAPTLTGSTTNYTTALMGIGSGGQAFQERQDKGFVTDEQYLKNVTASTLEGLWNAMWEGATGGTFATQKTVTDEAGKTVVQNSGWLDNLIFKKLADKGIVNTKNAPIINEVWKRAGEVVEEVGTDLFTAVTNQIAGEKFSDNWNWDKEKETILYTLLTTEIMNRAGIGGLDSEQFIDQYNITEEEYNNMAKSIEKELDKAGFTEEKAKELMTEKLKESGIDVNDIDKTVENVNNSEDYKTALVGMAKNLNLSDAQRNAVMNIVDNTNILTEQDFNEVKSKISDVVKETTLQEQQEAYNSASDEFNEIGEQIDNLKQLEPENIKNEASRKFYAEQVGKNIDDQMVYDLLAKYPENRNGKRTVRQWKDYAKDLGTYFGDIGKTIQEVRENTVRAYQEFQPTKNITKYDNVAKKTVGFDKFNNEIFSKEVYNAYKNTMESKLKAEQENIMNTIEGELQGIQDTSNITLDTINNFKIEPTNNIEITPEDNLITSAKKYGYDGEQLQRLQELFDKRGIKVRFDASKFNDNKTGALYEYTKNEDGSYTREIIFNPNANKETIVQEMAIHELTHDLIASGSEESKALYDDIVKYLKKDAKFNDELKSLEETYAKNTDLDTNSEEFKKLVEEEAVAKTLQQKLGTQEQINKLVKDDRTRAQKLYDWIKEKINDFKNRNNDEYKFWKQVEKRFEKAFNNPEFNPVENNNQVKYSDEVESQKQGSFNLPEIKEGYTRLYRGLENEYNNNYDKSKIDNVNGYESWTDNYDLAKAYGDNVYYIDVPTSEIKNSILDEDSNSETYGDRNLIYKNDKPVSIKDKNGNEYMLYTDHDNYKDIQYNKVNQAPTTDNQNITITNKDKYKTEPKEGTIRLYTNTSANNIDSILRDGLLVSKAKQKEYEGKMTWFETRPDLKGYGGTTIAVDVPSNISMEKLNGTQYGIYEDISPENIVFIDKPIFNTLRTSDLQNYSDKYGKDKVLEVYDKALDNNKYISREELVSLLDTIDSNTSNQPTTDNQGRELSKQQQDYFKDSKVRDENGNLLEVYHGTPNGNFTIFDKTKVNKGAGLEGLSQKGFYFTDNKELADYYSAVQGINEKNEVKETYLNMTNPLIVDLSNADTQQAIRDTFKLRKNKKLTDYFGDNYINKMLYNDAYGIKTEEQRQEYFNSTGYDGVIFKGNNGNEYIVFNSNQIKNVDNTNPTSNPDIRYSNNSNFDKYLEERIGKEGTRTSLEQLKLPTQKTVKPTINNITDLEEPKIQTVPSKNKTAVEQKIAKIQSEPVIKQKPSQRFWSIFKANIIDKGAVFEDLSIKAKNRELQAKWDSTLLAGSIGQYAIGNSRYDFENGKKTQISKSLTDIIDEVGEDVDAFNNYMYHQLNIDRMTLEDRFGGDTGINYERKQAIVNKPVFGESIDANYSKNVVKEMEEKHPEFKKYAKDVYDYLDANKKELVRSGVISQELSDRFKEMYPHYVPISRIDTNPTAIDVPLDTKRTGVNSPIKKATGGSQDIQPLFQTMADRTMQTYRASYRNSFGVELKNTLEQLGILQQTNEDVDVDTIMDTIADEENSDLTEATKTANPTFTVFENGNKVTYDINQDMYDALKPKNELLTKLDNNPFSKALQKVSGFRRGILTEFNPVFSLTNAIKDAQDVLMNSQHATKTYSKFPEAYAQILKKGYWYQEYMQNGGEQNSYFKDGDFTYKDKTTKDKIKSKLTLPLEAISKVNNVIEMAPRLAEYIASREAGRSVKTSMLDASRVTTNFKAGGDLTKFANRNGATFLNASVQGLAQNIRNVREANAKGLKGYGVLLGKSVVAGLPALILNNLIWKDDDDYKDLQDYVKDNYYIIGKIGDHQFLRIPKGRTVAVIQKMVSNADEFINNKGEINADEYAKTFWGDLKEDIDLAMNNIAPNNPIENNIFSPIIQAVTNKTWYGSDLVPTRLQDKPTNEQYDETTAEISKKISNALNKVGINSNPMAINYLLDQYGGGVSDVLLPIGTPQAENNVLEDKFTTNSVMKSKYPGEFFNKLDELTVNSNAYDSSDEDKLKYKYFTAVRGELSDLYKEKREIQNSNKSDNEKKKELERVQKQINDKSQKALESVKDVKAGSNYATIGGMDFIKKKDTSTGEDTWNKVSEKQRIQGVSLRTQADYENKVTNETIKERKNGTIKKEGILKDSTKAEILFNSNYSDNEKKAIYDAKIGEQDKLFDGLKKTDVEINDYLNYKSNKFEGDKDENGKTITNSKKNNIIEWLNDNVSDYNTKLVLLGYNNKLTRTEQQQLAEYINTQPNSNELFELLTKNFTIKNGQIYYK